MGLPGRLPQRTGCSRADEVTVETTSVFRADFLNELDAPAQAGTESAVSGVESTRHLGGPASRQRHLPRRRHREPSARRIPLGKRRIPRRFLDDVTVSRRHAEFRLESDEFHVVDVGSLNGTYVNREPVDSA
ncbi:FHA domain-containing protein, partial [Mycolicibacterium pulveris]|nr:FHA domain-containing protein [Mycolicibacterium pulveris]